MTLVPYLCVWLFLGVWVVGVILSFRMVDGLPDFVERLPPPPERVAAPPDPYLASAWQDIAALGLGDPLPEELACQRG